MSFKKKYIKLNDNNLELETFSLPTDSTNDRENGFQEAGFINSDELQNSFSTPFKPLEDFEDMIDNKSFEELNEKYLELPYNQASMLQKFWYGPETLKDIPPQFNEGSLLYKINEFPRFFHYRVNQTTRILGLILFTVFHAFFTLYFLYIPYIYTTDNIVSLECNSRLYYPPENNNACGLNLESCGPFESSIETTVRCPALCDRGGWVYAPVTVGDKRVRYESFVVGEDYYRADSFVCAAAYADRDNKQKSTRGVISRFFGGCVNVKHVGAQLDFPTKKNIQFDSFYPSSFVLKPPSFLSSCIDPRFYILLINTIAFAIVFYLYESELSFWWLVVEGFWFQALVMDPARLVDPRDVSSFAELVSYTAQKFLPLCFILFVIYTTTIRRTFDNSYVSYVWKMGWLASFWLGLLNNITFDRLPVDRLTIEDLKEQSGGIAATAFIFSIIIVSAIVQGINVWKSGLFSKYFKFYISVILFLLILASIPGFGLRIHHYILGMVLIPGCSTRGKSAYILQGVLIGLILNGIARWDFASIIETQKALLRGSAGSALLPPKMSFISIGKEEYNISWESQFEQLPPLYDSLTAFSLLLNDVEVYVGSNTTVNIPQLMDQNQLVNELITGALEYEENVKLYWRVAHCQPGDSQIRGDYTNAATLIYPSGNWTDPFPGVS